MPKFWIEETQLLLGLYSTWLNVFIVELESRVVEVIDHHQLEREETSSVRYVHCTVYSGLYNIVEYNVMSRYLQ